MSATYIEELGDIYGSTIITESETVGKQDPLEQNNAALKDTGPGVADNVKPVKSAEGHEDNLSQPVKKGKKAVKKESAKINNSSMKEAKNNKSTFDRLFEDVMGGDLDMEMGDDDLGGGGDDLDLGGDDEFADNITLDLPRDVAEQLHTALGDMLGGEGEGDIDDIEDVEDGGDEFENIESHVELTAAPDSTAGLQGQNNKVGGDATPGGGSAAHDAAGQEDGGKPKAAHDGVGALQNKNNKVGGKVTGGNKNLFKA